MFHIFKAVAFVRRVAGYVIKMAIHVVIGISSYIVISQQKVLVYDIVAVSSRPEFGIIGIFSVNLVRRAYYKVKRDRTGNGLVTLLKIRDETEFNTDFYFYITGVLSAQCGKLPVICRGVKMKAGFSYSVVSG